MGNQEIKLLQDIDITRIPTYAIGKSDDFSFQSTDSVVAKELAKIHKGGINRPIRYQIKERVVLEQFSKHCSGVVLLQPWNKSEYNMAIMAMGKDLSISKKHLFAVLRGYLKLSATQSLFLYDGNKLCNEQMIDLSKKEQSIGPKIKTIKHSQVQVFG